MPGRLRVVAGSRGGLRLAAPPDARPTSERVREALFSALTARDVIRGAVVLDLFAGSGALAIEALSRGAARAVLVDHDRGAQEACDRNLETTGLTEHGRVQRMAVAAFLTREPPAEAPFDLVLCDPPYDLPDDDVADVLAALGAPRWLRAGASVVVERPAPAWDPPDGWSASWQRRYGDTLMTILNASE